jgi:transketolase
MAAALNGMAVSKIRPFGGTFFNFSDYNKPSIRLAALMEIPTIFIFTHDSIGLGEDGPTHQPIEQLAGLRAMPGLMLIRPADANEVVEAWKVIMKLKHEPALLVLSRQAVPTFDRTKYGAASGVAQGGYILADAPDGKPEVILMGTGTEVSLCASAYEQLKAEGVKARVVSIPSWNLFDQQSDEYKNKVLPPDVKARVAVEQASTFGWSQYVGPSGIVIGMRRFGASAPIKELQKKFGFTTENVVAMARKAMGK